jgi:2-dehydro-3-deoxyglucarate aldolase/4-hydroxy-2-oxoheptanedioate aldolase
MLYGTMLSLPDAAVAEILAGTGFDWLFVDGEHGPFSVRDIERVLQAVGHRVACLVRVPGHEETPIKQALDLGASGIIVPQVNTADQACSVVSFARYAPRGSRGVGLARAHGYGNTFAEYVAGANDSISVVVQAEHIEAVRNIEKIAAVEGVDAVLVGPYDLSASLGKTGQLTDPEVQGAIAKVTTACATAGKPLGIFGIDAPSVLPFIDNGYNLIAAGVDTLFLGRGAKALLAALEERRD